VADKLDRETIVARLRAERVAGRAIYDALCGSGITAKMAARGGANIVTTHCLAYFRMQGLSSMAGYLPICDANALTLEIGERASTSSRIARWSPACCASIRPATWRGSSRRSPQPASTA
jgi:predicted TIM-barrel enzyme